MEAQKLSTFPIRVYYEDTDAGGIVYYANYLKFFERARTEWLRELGFEQHVLLSEDIAFVVRHVDMHNHAPAKFDEIIKVHTQLSELKKVSMVFTQTIKKEDIVLVSATIQVACVKLDRMKPCAIPSAIYKECLRVA
ncbi:MAG: tol-pal system-associated acyl-CoA thioesterase [Glaciecola sp.]|jgi:acyl-CoA thioester hydrolase|uniref:tol-pal system-associated acyl-CoA thioesterase n=1 Tax=Glaciecola sp. HTCC2999 TaxID=455436 RepID=UPI0000E0F7B3|nr:tol-pal system-associated acyl-CoA thioesterase [Glaciecola sp. HTCC2999]